MISRVPVSLREVHGKEEESNYHQGHEILLTNAHNCEYLVACEWRLRIVHLLEVHGKEEESNYCQGHEISLRNAHKQRKSCRM